jgi:hypothetical protein
VPILVCLTFGDKLYAEHMTDGGGHPRASDMTKVIKSQVTVSYIVLCIRRNFCQEKFFGPVLRLVQY